MINLVQSSTENHQIFLPKHNITGDTLVMHKKLGTFGEPRTTLLVYIRYLERKFYSSL